MRSAIAPTEAVAPLAAARPRRPASQRIGAACQPAIGDRESAKTAQRTL